VTADIQQFTLGQATVSVINIGDLYLPLADNMTISATEMRKQPHSQPLLDLVRMPIYCVCVQLPKTTVLIDAGIYDVNTYPQYAIPDYTPPPTLIENLAQIGLQPEAIQHLIVTHLHWDHFNGLTVRKEGRYVPQFPNATVYLGQADWDAAQNALTDPTTLEYNTLRPLAEENQLHILTEATAITDTITVIPAPAETAGHQIVRIESAGETLYCVGDLYNHPVEFIYPDWMVSWSDPAATQKSRSAFVARALSENALIVAAHIRTIGRLQQTDAGIRWVPTKSGY